MAKRIELSTEQLATLLWIKALDDFEDGVNISLRDKYYNFIENNSVIEGMESAEFDSFKEKLVSCKLLKEDEEKLEFTKKGREVVEILTNTEKKKGLQPYKLKNGVYPDFAAIKKFIDDNSNIIQAVLATASLLVEIIK